ncbi:AlpA family transcriptional regulator [Litoreibacter ponti]|uniref:AlpA family transcriptional regulator n=1 Tax=Litoreibacter ponti TaxID=1510457 RepID=A0A2T6BF32_9RHOB|nr:AlpA family transcriptional regulator [Litoreibacter ponti]
MSSAVVRECPPWTTMHMESQMSHTYLSDTQVAARYSVHRTTPWRWGKSDPSFPKPVSLTRGCTRWKLADLEAWEAAKSRNAL